MRAVIRAKILKLVILAVFALVTVLTPTVTFGSGGGSGGGGAGESWCQPDYDYGEAVIQVADSRDILYSGTGNASGLFWNGNYSIKHGLYIAKPTGQPFHSGEHTPWRVQTEKGIVNVSNYKYRPPSAYWSSPSYSGDTTAVRIASWDKIRTIKGNCPPDEPPPPPTPDPSPSPPGPSPTPPPPPTPDPSPSPPGPTPTPSPPGPSPTPPPPPTPDPSPSPPEPTPTPSPPGPSPSPSPPGGGTPDPLDLLQKFN